MIYRVSLDGNLKKKTLLSIEIQNPTNKHLFIPESSDDKVYQCSSSTEIKLSKLC